MHVPAIRRSDDKAFLFYVLQDQHRAAACHLCNLKRALFARGNIIAPGVLDCLIEKTTQGWQNPFVLVSQCFPCPK